MTSSANILPLGVSPSIRRSSRRLPRSKSAAFTLIEIMVVLAILGLLVGVLINGVGKSFDNARIQTAQIFVGQTLKGPLTEYNIQMGSYPTTQQGLQALVTAPPDRADQWHGPYVENGKIPLDPWSRPYHYACPGNHNKDGYDLWSKGPDKTDGTDDDIGNW